MRPSRGELDQVGAFVLVQVVPRQEPELYGGGCHPLLEVLLVEREPVAEELDDVVVARAVVRRGLLARLGRHRPRIPAGYARIRERQGPFGVRGGLRRDGRRLGCVPRYDARPGGGARADHRRHGRRNGLHRRPLGQDRDRQPSPPGASGPDRAGASSAPSRSSWCCPSSSPSPRATDPRSRAQGLTPDAATAARAAFVRPTTARTVGRLCPPAPGPSSRAPGRLPMRSRVSSASAS